MTEAGVLITLALLNRFIKSEFPALDLKLVKDSTGYFYFVGKDSMGFSDSFHELDQIDSIYVNSLQQLSFDRWKDEIRGNILKAFPKGVREIKLGKAGRRLAEAVNKEMALWHEERTGHHIALVKKYCQKIHEYDPGRFPDILARGENHDASKFVAPELDPYILVSWMHKCENEGKPFTCAAGDKERMHQATGHHIKTNDHHPEFYCSGNPVNKEDRDTGMIMDARLMPDMAIAEMVADWCAMSEELGNTPSEWAAKVIGTRYIFSGVQQALINELISSVWARSVGETVRVGTSQACVLHGHPKKAGSKTDKPAGTPIKCYPFSGSGGRAGAIKKAYAMHHAISKNEGSMKDGSLLSSLVTLWDGTRKVRTETLQQFFGHNRDIPEEEKKAIIKALAAGVVHWNAAGGLPGKQINLTKSDSGYRQFYGITSPSFILIMDRAEENNGGSMKKLSALLEVEDKMKRLMALTEAAYTVYADRSGGGFDAWFMDVEGEKHFKHVSDKAGVEDFAKKNLAGMDYKIVWVKAEKEDPGTQSKGAGDRAAADRAASMYTRPDAHKPRSVRKVARRETVWGKDGRVRTTEEGIEEISEGVARLRKLVEGDEGEWMGRLKELGYMFTGTGPNAAQYNFVNKKGGKRIMVGAILGQTYYAKTGDWRVNNDGKYKDGKGLDELLAYLKTI